MIKKTAVKFSFAGLVWSLSGDAESGPVEPRPNILLIVSDDQGYGDFSCYGNPILKTPNLDRLFSQSTRLVNYCVSPLCAPTRAALMTGRHEYYNGVYDTYGGRAVLREDAVTFPRLLQNAGYRTGFFHKWHLGDHVPSRPQDKGFGHVCTIDKLPGMRSLVTVNETSREVDRFHDDAMADEAIRFIKESNAPFFAYVASKLPHDCPLPMVPDEYLQPYLDAELSIGDASVYGMIANLDHNIGRLLAVLDEEGLAENTVVIFFPDNGALRDCPDLETPYERSVVKEYEYTARYNMGLRGGKTLVYEGGIRVPCFVKWPGHFEAGRDIQNMTAHVDWFPTLLEIAGASVPSDLLLDGRSLLPLLDGVPERWDNGRVLVFQSHRVENPQPWVNACVRGNRFKLVNRTELYDLSNDPGETKNVSEQYADVVEKYRSIYAQWVEQVRRSNDGFKPSYAMVGSDKEPVVSLSTKQAHSAERPDGRAWQIKVAETGVYKIKVSGVRSEWFGSEGALIFRFGGEVCRLAVEENVACLEGEMKLEKNRVGDLSVEPLGLEGTHTQIRGIHPHPGFAEVSLRRTGE